MIPHIVKGSGITGAIRYNMGEGNDRLTGERKELAPGAETRSQILGGQNFGFEIDSAERVELARRAMEFNARPENQTGRRGQKCHVDCLHMSLSWPTGEEPSREEMIAASESALKALGMERAQAVFFAHSDTAQRHVHIVASRIDPLTGRTFSDTLDNVKVQGWALRWERETGVIPEKRYAQHAIADAAIARDGDKLLDLLTRQNPTFTAANLKHALMLGELPEQEVKGLTQQLLSGERVIGLRDKADGPIKRYTTREVLGDERDLQAAVGELAKGTGYGAGPKAQREAAIRHTLKPEQADALHHATGDGAFAMIAGQAGTGKSRVFEAIRDAYQAEGCRVIGLGPKNDIAVEMRSKGFQRAETVHAELGLRPDGTMRDPDKAPSASWDRNTVLIVDEAAMLSTRNLALLAARAEQAGAKLILAGDDKQIQSVERGGMFAVLAQQHGCARLDEVQRTKSMNQKEAWGLAHKGEFGPALDRFDKDGMLHWAKTGPAAERDLLQKFAADFKADPDKTRFIFAHTNEQVGRLNAAAREAMRAAGKLGADHSVQTQDGPAKFAVGDRLQFIANARDRTGIRAGFVIGATGTVQAITQTPGHSRLTLKMDNGRELKFTVGEGKTEFNAFRHGYAGTVHKGQGASIDQTYSLVTKGWFANLSYVALTRHKESTGVFTSADVATDRASLARVMARDEKRQAASSYIIDQPSLARSGLGLKQAADRMGDHLSALQGVKIDAKAPRKGKEGGSAEKAPKAPAATERRSGAGIAAGNAAANVVGGAARAAVKALDGLSSLFEGLIAPEPPSRKAQGEEGRQPPPQTVSREEQNDALEAALRQLDTDAKRRELYDKLERMYPAELEQARRMREREDDERGRERSR